MSLDWLTQFLSTQVAKCTWLDFGGVVSEQSLVTVVPSAITVAGVFGAFIVPDTAAAFFVGPSEPVDFPLIGWNSRKLIGRKSKVVLAEFLLEDDEVLGRVHAVPGHGMLPVNFRN